MNVWEAVRNERLSVADQVEELTDEQWNTSTLCTEWRVRDVIAHLERGAVGDFRILPLLTGLARSGFNFNRFIATGAKQRGEEADPKVLVDSLRQHAGNQKHPPGTKPVTVLSDVIVHGQDIARPLGLKRDISDENLRAVADYFKGLGFPFGTKKKIAGLTLRATDLEWSTGTGPEVTGPLEALVMAMAGRKSAVDDLVGEGKSTLASRL